MCVDHEEGSQEDEEVTLFIILQFIVRSLCDIIHDVFNNRVYI